MPLTLRGFYRKSTRRMTHKTHAGSSTKRIYCHPKPEKYGFTRLDPGQFQRIRTKQRLLNVLRIVKSYLTM
jgi:hypothetical protein